MQYSTGDVSKIMSVTSTLNEVESDQLQSSVFRNDLPDKKDVAAKVCIFSLF